MEKRLRRLLQPLALAAVLCGIHGIAGAAPTITQQPTNQTVSINGTFNLSVTATGTGNVSYQWSLNNHPIYYATYSSFGEPYAQPGEAGNYNVVVTDSTGSTTSATATLTVLPEPPPNGLMQSLLGFSTQGPYGTQTSLFSSLAGNVNQAIEWFKDGVVLPNSSTAFLTLTGTSGAEGTYAPVLGNSSGAYAGSPVYYSIGESNPPPNQWIDAQELAGVAYFLFSNPAQMQRYDLATGTWLPTVGFPQTPTAMLAASEGVYIAFGRTTSLFTSDLTSSSQITNVSSATSGMFANPGYVFLVNPSSDENSGTIVAINRSSQQVAAPFSLDGYSGLNAMVTAPSGMMAFGWEAGEEPTGMVNLVLNPDGSISWGSMGTGIQGTNFDQKRVVFSPDGSKMIVDTGGVFSSSTYALQTALGMPVADVCFLPDGSPVALRAASMTLYDPASYFSVGSVPIATPAERVFASGSTIYAFSAPASSGGTPGVATYTESQLAASPRGTLPELTPGQCASVNLAPTHAFLGSDGIVYLLQRPLGNILRWSPAQGAYLGSIPLTGIPSGMSYSSELNRIYVDYPDRRITQINLSASTAEQPFAAYFTDIVALLAAGDQVYLELQGFQSTGRELLLVSSGGAITAINTSYGYPDEFPSWNDALGLVFDVSVSGGLESVPINGGIFGSPASGPYNPSTSYPQPYRFSADGTLLVDGAGIVYDTSSFAQAGALGSSLVDADWIGPSVYSIALTNGQCTATEWTGPSYLSQATATIAGAPLRILALSSTRLLVITEQPTGPAFTVLDASLNVVSQQEGSAQPFEEPLITLEPFSVTAAPGSPATLSAGATGTSLSESWYYIPTNQLVGTGPTLAFASVTALEAGVYQFVASGEGLGAQSFQVGLTVTAPPAFSTQPGDETVASGHVISLFSGANSFPPPTYQWYFNGTAIPGATQDVYQVASATSANAGTYTVVAANAYGSTTSSAAVVTVSTPPRAPSISAQPSSASVNRGAPVTFTVSATGNPAPTYQWYFNDSAIPGATSSTYTIASADPSQAGTYYVVVSNSAGLESSASATLSVSSTAITSVTSGPLSQSVQTGSSATFTVQATGSGTLAYQWSFNGAAIPGATGSGYSITNAQPSQSGGYAVSVTGLGGTAAAGAVLAVAGSSGAPALSGQPQSQTIQDGGTVVFSVLTDGTVSSGSSIRAASATTYQWYLNGMAVTAATNATLLISGATAADAGAYACLVTNSSGSILSAAANLVVAQSSNPGRLIDISCRSAVGTGANILIAGFVVGGQGTTGTLPVLVRSSGPALAAFNVSGYLPDPSLELFGSPSTTPIDSNSGWMGRATVASLASQVGAFAWSNTASLDSALAENLSPGAYTAQTFGKSGDSGVALAEVYDATPSRSYTPGVSPRLINMSTRVQVGTGGNELIAGFVIGGTTSQTVLIRASGPALTPFGLSGVLPDPQLQLFATGATSRLLATRAAWGGDAQIASVAASVGAFAWTSLSSNDAAILVTLSPGSYTANVSGASGDTGVALVEVYEVP